MRRDLALSGVGVALAGWLASTGCGRTPVDVGLRGGAGDGASAGLDEAERDDAGGVVDTTPQTCEQVDFLFVIDNSLSMADNQAKLIGNYETFIGGIRQTVERLESIHVGVITTDAYRHNRAGCDQLGSLVTRTGGSEASGKTCGPYAEGHRYMTDADNLADAFVCAAQVGTSGSGTESILSAPIAALNAPLTDPGGCNEGFLRDDALLVLVLITDEDADIDPVFAAAELITRKPGARDDVVAVVLANPTDGTCGLGGTTVRAFGLESFVQTMRYGFFGPICDDDYGDVLEAAVQAVNEACPG